MASWDDIGGLVLVALLLGAILTGVFLLAPEPLADPPHGHHSHSDSASDAARPPPPRRSPPKKQSGAGSTNVNAAGNGPVDSLNQFPGTGLLATLDNFPEFGSAFGCDPSVVEGVYVFCTTQLLDTDWLIDRLDQEPGAAYMLGAAAKTALRRRVLLTAAHCTRPLGHYFDFDKNTLKEFSGNNYFSRSDAYPFDDPVLQSGVVGFNYDMGLSPGRVRYADVASTANCASPLPSPRFTVQFNDVPGYPTYRVNTLAVGGIPAGGWARSTNIQDFMDLDTALMLVTSPTGIPASVVSNTNLQRVYLSTGFDDPTKKTLTSVTVAGFGVNPSGDPAKNYLGNPATPPPTPNTVSYRKVETPITVTTISGDGIHTNVQLAQGDQGTCGGDSGASFLRFNSSDSRWYSYAVNSVGDGLCRTTSYGKRIGTPNWREWVRRAVNSFMLYGLDNGAGNGSQHERLLSSEAYIAQYGA